ncbi:MAG: ABC transporter permease [Deltaproteobacteria bacterium]|nr:ABC transporter permease [Deltaproteobacteria bacterium]
MQFFRLLWLRGNVLVPACFALGAVVALVALVQHVLLRRRSALVRGIADSLATLGLALTAKFAVAASLQLLRLEPEVHPLRPASMRLLAIGLLIEAFLVSSFVWLPKLFDGLERTTGAMLVAVRQLRARKSGFLTAISFLAFLGVGLSSFGLCLTISVMAGFGNDLKHKILGNNAHVVIDVERGGFTNWRPLVDRIRTLPGVTTATALVQGEVMITSQTNLSGVLLRGIDPEARGTADNLRRELIRGRMEYLQEPSRLLEPSYEDTRPLTPRDTERPQATTAPRPAARGLPSGVAPLPPPPTPSPGSYVLPGLIIGRELASNLHLQVGDEVRAVSPFGGMITPAGPLPKTQSFRIAGIFYTGMYEYDTKYAFLTIRDAQSFFNYRDNEVSSIEVQVSDVDNAENVARAIAPIARPQSLRVRDWQELNRNLFRALKLEKLMMFVLLGVAIFVASFAVLATLLLLVMEKGREIALLKALGATDGFVARVFVFVGLLIGLVGATLGAGTALMVCTLVQKLGVPLDPEVYYIDRLPVHVTASDFGMIWLIAVGVCLLATILPAILAARMRPVEGMRFG